jgi:hypothetical protein
MLDFEGNLPRLEISSQVKFHHRVCFQFRSANGNSSSSFYRERGLGTWGVYNGKGVEVYMALTLSANKGRWLNGGSGSYAG